MRVWDLASGQSRTLTSHTSPVWAVAYNPDGRSLATASDDGTVRISTGIAATPTDAIDHICSAIGRDLTDGERRTYLTASDPNKPTCPRHTT